MSKTIRTKAPVKRTYKILQPVQADGTGSIRITCGKVFEVYDLTVYPAYDGTATGVYLTKTDGTRYEACLSADRENKSCSCPGHTYHREGKPCKHIDCLADMARKGNLPLPIIPTEEAEMDWLDAYELVAC